MSDLVLLCSQVTKSYHDGTTDIQVLKDMDLTVQAGESIAITGPSGSGKSTLLHLLGGLDKPDSGEIHMLGKNWQIMPEKKACQLRNKHVGFIYQFHHLLPEFTALENVSLPLILGGASISQAEKKAGDMLEKVGLNHRLTHRPSQLSGGERQRVAIARALVHSPDCVLADEPTGNLDQATAAKVFDLMLELNTHLHTAFIMVTHDLRLAERMDRILELKAGKVV